MDKCKASSQKHKNCILAQENLAYKINYQGIKKDEIEMVQNTRATREEIACKTTVTG